MALVAGTQLGSYEILVQVGAGGMGEVYSARDSNLKREVAIKVLPEAFSQDPERLARFQREARLLASLNHPHIATIHGLEESGGTHYLVMELVPGDTLAERIKRDGGVPIDEALGIATQIAEALEHAHEHGIIHRDLKPANVKVTPDGQVKVLDFGLAKAFSADGTDTADTFDSNSPTVLTGSPTMPGVILGTAAYMSPEQAKGKAVDKRTDIWAFGCVLYELITGKQTFPGEDVSDIIAGILRGEPDWSALPSNTPENIRFVLRRCLTKNATERFHASADVRIQIAETGSAPTNATIAHQPAWRKAIPLVIASLIMGAVIASIVWNFGLGTVAAPKPVERLMIGLEPDAPLATGNYKIVALSPDGGNLVYVASNSSGPQLYLRAMDSLEAQPIGDTEGAGGPFFSPDGQWIGFFADGSLKKVSINGGAVLTLSPAAIARGGTWGPDDTIVFGLSGGSGLMQVSTAGGEPQRFTTFQQGETSHRWPQFLPDGETVLFTVFSGDPNNSQIAVQRSGATDHEILIRGGTYTRYVPTGHLVYHRAGTIMAVSFDPVTVEVTGTPAPVLENVLSTGSGVSQFSYSGRGTLVYVPGDPQLAAKRTLVWVNREGTVEPFGAPPQGYSDPRLSPDGRRLAVSIAGQNQDIWVFELGRQTLSRLTFDPGSDELPVWSPEGKWVTYAGDRDGVRSLMQRLADGSEEEEVLVTLEEHAHANSWSPDGQVLVFGLGSQTASDGIWLLPLEGDRKAELFLKTPFNLYSPRLSPDGHWIAYASDESGRSEIYVQPFPGLGGKWQISTDGGKHPVWARNGQELFYRNGDQMMVVAVTTQPNFFPGSPKPLFEGQFHVGSDGQTNYDVAPDGQRFVMIQESEETQEALTQINVVLNWFEELKEKVPTGD